MDRYQLTEQGRTHNPESVWVMASAFNCAMELKTHQTVITNAKNPPKLPSITTGRRATAKICCAEPRQAPCQRMHKLNSRYTKATLKASAAT